MSAQIRRKNDRSKLVEQDFGRRLYAANLSYSEAMKQTTQKYMDSMMLIKQSEFEKPYREDDYNTMEYSFEPPNPPEYPPGPGWPDPDCTPKGDAVGGGSHLCEDGISCGQWIFTCAHRIISFEVVQDFGWIESINYGENDTVTVTVCWNENDRDAGRKIGPKAILANGKNVISTVDFGTCCPTTKACNGKCNGCPAPTIGYTSQQMSCGGTQTLTHTGGGAGGKYTWAVDFGTLSTPIGASVIYTAPAANAGCAYNPTITLTDCCGHQGTLKLGVSCVVWVQAAIRVFVFNPNGDPGCVYHYAKYIDCSGNEGTGVFCCRDGCGNPDCNTINCCGNPDVCGKPLPCSDVRLGFDCSTRVVDIRTQPMKDAGCCPVQLLP